MPDTGHQVQAEPPAAREIAEQLMTAAARGVLYSEVNDALAPFGLQRERFKALRHEVIAQIDSATVAITWPENATKVSTGNEAATKSTLAAEIMAETVAPNPRSPFANAHPMVRHLLPGFLGIAPEPGSLAVTGCGRMAVTPDEALTDVTDLISAGRVGALPPGLCPHCVGVAVGEELPEDYPPIAPSVCRECRGQSSQGVLCALCRQEFHAEWWPTRDAGTPKPRPTTREINGAQP